jgi:hypothetical protein
MHSLIAERQNRAFGAGARPKLLESAVRRVMNPRGRDRGIQLPMRPTAGSDDDQDPKSGVLTRQPVSAFLCDTASFSPNPSLPKYDDARTQPAVDYSQTPAAGCCGACSLCNPKLVPTSWARVYRGSHLNDTLERQPHRRRWTRAWYRASASARPAWARHDFHTGLRRPLEVPVVETVFVLVR